MLQAHKEMAEDVIEIESHPERINPIVPDPSRLFVTEKGTCKIHLRMQNIRRYLINEIDVGPCDELHMWVRLQGGDEISQISNGVVSLQAQYWYWLYASSTSETGRELFRSIGVGQAGPLEDISLGLVNLKRKGQCNLGSGHEFIWSLDIPDEETKTYSIRHKLHTWLDDEELLHIVDETVNVRGFERKGRMICGDISPLPVLESIKEYAITGHAFSSVFADLKFSV